MCLIVLLHRIIPEYPLILAANRDERYTRRGEVPTQWQTPQIFAGRDTVGGGTWLGVNRKGVVVALSNRKGERPDEPNLRSRGQLVLDALAADNAAVALNIAQESLRENQYNPFNLLCVDVRRAAVLHHAPDRDRLVELPVGVHVLTTGDVNDMKIPKVARAYSLITKRKPNESRDALELLQRVCRDHGGVTPSEETLCMHGEHAGTVSSSIISLNPRGNLETYQHVQGLPCKGEYKTVFAMA